MGPHALSNLANLLGETEKAVSAKIIRNVRFGIFRFVLIGPIPFILTPFILAKLGSHGFGTWAVFLAIINLTSLADLGLVGTLSKHVSQYYAEKDFDRLNRLVNTAVVLALSLVSLLTFVLWAVSPVLIPFLFRDSRLSQTELTSFWHWGILLVAVNALTLLLNSVAVGLQRLDLTNIIASFNVLLAAALTVILLSLSWELRGLLWANLTAAVVTLTASILVLRVLLPSVKLDPRYFDLQEMRTILSFSLQMYLTQMAVVVHNQLEKLYLARFVGVVPAGWYEIASDAAFKIRSAPALLLNPIVPAASELAALSDHRRMSELYYRASKYLALFSVPLGVYLVFVSDRLIYLWLGAGFDVVVTPFRILLLVNLLNLATGPGYLIFVGNGNLRPGMYSALLGIGLNILLSGFLIYFYGFPGAVAGTSVSLILASSLFIYLFHRGTGNSFGRLVRESHFKPLVCSVVIVGVLALIDPTHKLGWFGLLGQAIAFGLLYLLSLALARFFDAFDLSKFEAHFPLTRFVRRVIPVA